MINISLKDFINKIGDKEAGKLFKVKERTAKSWRLGARIPRQEKAQSIVKITTKHPIGSITYDGIYGV